MKIFLKSISLVLFISITIMSRIPTIAAAPVKFSDVKESSWYYTYVNRLVELNITAGIGNNKFGPNKTVTRAEFVTFLINATGRTKIDGYTYSDTEKHWAKQYISAAVDANFIDQGTNFNPNKAITRQEAVEMLCRSINLLSDSIMQTPFADVTENPGYSSTAYKEYLMMGSVDIVKRYFKPSSNITRAETAAILVNLVDYKASPDKYKATKKAEFEQEQSEADKYQEWLNTLDKGVSQELLTNTLKLLEGEKSPYESNKSLVKEMINDGYWDAWFEDTTATNGIELAALYIENARKAVTAYYNMNYTKLDELKTTWKEVMSYNYNYAFASKEIKNAEDNTIVMEGVFYTGLGMLTHNENGQPAVRGTIRYRYLSPSNPPVGKKINVWYEDDIRVKFYPESTGLKVASFTELSSTRVVK